MFWWLQIYFYWVCRETQAFEWFTDLLQSLEKQMTDKDMSDFLSYNIYLTRWKDTEVRKHETCGLEPWHSDRQLMIKILFMSLNWRLPISEFSIRRKMIPSLVLSKRLDTVNPTGTANSAPSLPNIQGMYCTHTCTGYALLKTFCAFIFSLLFFFSSKVGVFLCGPTALAKALGKQCLTHTESGTEFIFNKENFWSSL